MKTNPQGQKCAPTIPKERGRKLRRATTAAEHRLWWELRHRALGVKFRRQHPIGPYVADFCSLEAMVVVEIDGGQHDEDDHRRADERRTQYLEQQGYRVLRVWNNEVLSDLQAVVTYLAWKFAPQTPPLLHRQMYKLLGAARSAAPLS